MFNRKLVQWCEERRERTGRLSGVGGRKRVRLKSEKMKKPEYSVYLSDYIDVGIFGEDDDKNELELYIKKHKINSINNKISIIVDNKPIEVGIDPNNKLIDTNSEDNRKKIKEESL